MLDPGLDDEDIAEIFSEPVVWAKSVRKSQNYLRYKEPIPRHLEYLDDGLCDGDPSPSEILERAEEIRASRPPEYAERPAFIKSIHWRKVREPGVSWGSARRTESRAEVGGGGPSFRQMCLPWEEAGGEEP